MLKIITISSLLLLSGCFQQRDRSLAFKNKSTSDSDYFSGIDSDNAESSRFASGGASGDDVIISSDTSSSTSIPSEVSHCSWSSNQSTGYAQASNAHIGAHTICQSSSNPDDVYIQVKDKILDAQVCLIPIHHSQTKSIYVGEPRCLMLSDNTKIHRVRLYKNRSGYSGSTITGVMMMKDKAYQYPPPYNQIVLSPDAYIFCSQFLDKYNYDGYCVAFKSVGQYVHKQF